MMADETKNEWPQMNGMNADKKGLKGGLRNELGMARVRFAERPWNGFVFSESD